jgi:hypothetical protein
LRRAVQPDARAREVRDAAREIRSRLAGATRGKAVDEKMAKKAGTCKDAAVIGQLEGTIKQLRWDKDRLESKNEELEKENFNFKIQLTPEELKGRAECWDRVIGIVRDYRDNVHSVDKILEAIDDAFTCRKKLISIGYCPKCIGNLVHEANAKEYHCDRCDYKTNGFAINTRDGR